jgi:methyl-accepting chemotaxis protein
MISIRELSVGMRLGLGFTVILLLFVATGLFSVREMGMSAAATSEMIRVPLMKERLAEEWYRSIYAGSRRTSAIAKSSDTQLEGFFADDAKQSAARGNALQNQLESLFDSERERKLFADVRQKRQLYIEARTALYALKAHGDLAGAETLLRKQFLPASDAYLGTVAAVLAYQKERINLIGGDIQAQNERSRRIVLGLIVTATLLSFVFAFALTSSIVRPIKLALEAVTEVASGDLSREPSAVHVTDEIGLLLRQVDHMRWSLADRIARVAHGTRVISIASNEIAQGNMDLSARTESQAASLEETACTMERINATVKETADSADSARRVVASAAEVAMRVGKRVGEITATMNAIDHSSRQISEIISVIDGIAFQTNILALNAAVEAARAGEYGRGFAVVATEVRSLAQRAAGAAKDIKHLILGSVEHVNAGGQIVSTAGVTMDEMLASVQGIIGMTTKIAQSSADQGWSIEQIYVAIRDMDAITQQNAALVEQASAAAQAMDEQSQALMRLVSEFKLPKDKGQEKTLTRLS